MLFSIFVIVQIVLLVILLFLSALPFFPRFSFTQSLRLRKTVQRIAFFVILASLVGNLVMGYYFVSSKSETETTVTIKLFTAARVKDILSMHNLMQILPPSSQQEIESSRLRYAADEALSASFDVDSLGAFYRDLLPKGTTPPFYGDTAFPKREDLSMLLQNSSSTLFFIAEQHKESLTFVPSQRERDIIESIRSIVQTLQEETDRLNPESTLSELEGSLSRYETYQVLLQTDPQIQELYKTIAEYGK